ncbi:MAG TPA: glycosyltransferase family 2 protein [Flavipsychrobacter sp.]|nr:glycosyltransferase family 2 protein [Flavipsychrobacter sp.]
MSAVVSIITPSFNRADIVHETAESIFKQTYPHWEWMIVDDGSTDNSWELLEQYAAKDSRVRIYKRDRDPKGACVCRNIAVQRSTGDYVMFLDTDDVLASFCLEQRVKAIQENPDCDFVIFPMLMFKQKPDDMKLLWNIDNGKDDIARILTGDAICQGTGTLWKKRSFIDIGMWDEELLLWQDIELHLRSLLGGMHYKKRLDLLPDVFLRISEVSLSRTGFHSLPKFISRLRVFNLTASEMHRQGKIAAYREEMRSMFADIFANAAYSNYFEQASEMLDMQQQWQLFSVSEQRWFRNFLFTRKHKLYKIPMIEQYVTARMKKDIGREEGTLNKVIYKTEVHL